MYKTMTDPVTGRTQKSGLDLVPAERTAPPRGGIYRAVVLQTYATDDPIRSEAGASTTRVYEVECDIILERSQLMYPRVPVQQPVHGIANASLWIPKGSDAVVGGGPLNLRRLSLRGTQEEPPPNMADLNGDQVLVQFLEADPEYPIITGALSHVRTNRRVVDGDGWAESGGNERGSPGLGESYKRHAGTELRVNASGDALLDTEGANPTDESTELPNPASGGLTRLRLKRGQRLTVECGGVDVLEIYSDLITGDVHIDLGEGASERMVRGNRLVAWLLAHIHPSGAGPTGPPPPAAGGETADLVTNNASFLSRLHKIENDSDGSLP